MAKKKRVNQASNAAKMSTRSGRKPKLPQETIETEQIPVSEQQIETETKVVVKKAGRGRPKLKRPPPPPKKKAQSEVISDSNTQQEDENSIETVENSEINEISDEISPKEDEILEMQVDDDVEKTNETSEIVEQLENLNVEAETAENEETTVEESVSQPEIEEQIETIENFNELTVEFVTEEELVVGETSEVVIEDSNESEARNEVDELVQDLEGDEPNPEITEEKIDIPIEPETTNIILEEPEVKTEETAPIEAEPEQIPTEIKAKTIEEELELMETNEIKTEIPISNPNPVIETPTEIKLEEKLQEIGLEPEKEKKTTKLKPAKKRATKKEPKEPKKPPQKKKPKPSKKESLDKTEEVRRSSRIKSISVQKQRSKGHGLVKTTKPIESEVVETSNSSSLDAEKPADSPNITQIPAETENKPVKVKSRWRRSSELEMNVLTPAAVVLETCGDSDKIAEFNDIAEKKQTVNNDVEVEQRLKQFVHLKENLYLTDRMTCKEAKKMTCDCFLTNEEIERGEWGCGEDCLNRLLMIECGSFCPVGDRCTNKKFQKTQFAPVEVFKTDKKGLGLRAAANIPYGEFILEYVGEVLDHDEFDTRADDYSNDKNRHYYFMSLRADAIIDATMKGNISRFINHSCEPNAETQKWTVNGELRIGFFSTRTILAGEEITFDYRFQRYGKEAQKCYCEAPTCRGWLGEEPDDDDDEDEDEDEEEENEETKEEPLEKSDEPLEKITPAQPKPKREPKPKKERKKRLPRKPRKDIFEDLDQLDDEIEMLVTTGLKNQAHTLKLSRLMVRAKEPAQRTKLLRILRRGELPCRRLFLDYHGLRLMHGYMTDAQHLAKTDKKFDSLRLEMLQTLATLPIPNKTMLQDSKVLSTVEKWSLIVKDETIVDSDSSPAQDIEMVTEISGEKEKQIEEVQAVVEEEKVVEAITEEIPKVDEGVTENGISEVREDKEVQEVKEEGAVVVKDEEKMDVVEVKPESEQINVSKTEEEKIEEQPNYEEEITALALKLLEEWSNLKEVFKIPKKERIEQMKEHEREANRGYIAGIGLEQDAEKKNESRYRVLKRYRSSDTNKIDTNSSNNRKYLKLEDRFIVNFPKMSKFERRKMFALQVEQREEERRRKQREMWRQHEQHCILLGTDPRLTAPFDPNRGYQCIWNPQIGQWQNYPIQNPNMVFNAAAAAAANMVPPNAQQPPPPQFPPYLHGGAGMLQGNALHPLPPLPYQEEVKKEEDYTQVKFMGPIPPPVKLPPKWKCCKDKYGRPYYYHVRLRKSQWEPPPLSLPQEDPDDSSETTSSSDTSSLSSETSSDDSDSDDDIDDSRLLLEVHRHVEKQNAKKNLVAIAKNEDESSNSPQVEETSTIINETVNEDIGDDVFSTVDARLKEMFKEDKPQSVRKRKAGLVHEIIISPRSEEDRLQFREDVKRYKQNKEKLKKEKELIQQHSKKHGKEKRPKTAIKLKMKEMNEANSEHAKRIKETFRSNMATVVVSVLNAYRKPDCKEGRITNTEDFKHLARKLTHFVMLKEMKHIEKIEDLVCTENVKGKAKEYIRKYMSKFGENYQKRMDEPDF